MATKSITWQEAADLTAHRPEGSGIWAYGADSNATNGNYDWTGLQAGDFDDGDPGWGPYAFTDSETEVIDISMFTPDEISMFHDDMREDAIDEGNDTVDEALAVAYCPADDEPYDKRFDLTHELHDSEHLNHHKFCDLMIGHWHEAPEGQDLDVIHNTAKNADEEPDAWLATVRFSPLEALERVNSFLSIFEDDGYTDFTTLDIAIETIHKALKQAAMPLTTGDDWLSARQAQMLSE